ncbi:MAG: hypothetical protein QG597_4754 [Actinomycetota bacterium]|nr:hypothetical protein [Actinomycetota bacterium]
MSTEQPPTDPAAEIFTATDARRAVALIAHAAAGDRAGMRLILAEAADVGELGDLAAASAATTLDFCPALRSAEGLAALRELAAALAAAEDDPEAAS